MLNARCNRLPCRNAYVTICHGMNEGPAPRLAVASGHNANGPMSAGMTDCNRNSATLATISAVVTGGMQSRRSAPLERRNGRQMGAPDTPDKYGPAAAAVA